MIKKVNIKVQMIGTEAKTFVGESHKTVYSRRKPFIGLARIVP